MRVYQLTYRIASEVDKTSDMELWPRVKATYNLDDSYQYSSKEMAEYASQFRKAVNKPFIEWFGSEREAVVRRLHLFKGGGLSGKKGDQEIWAIDIPTDKRGLLAWLQENVK
jgi:hypothetical protein